MPANRPSPDIGGSAGRSRAPLRDGLQRLRLVKGFMQQSDDIVATVSGFPRRRGARDRCHGNRSVEPRLEGGVVDIQSLCQSRAQTLLPVIHLRQVRRADHRTGPPQIVDEFGKWIAGLLLGYCKIDERDSKRAHRWFVGRARQDGVPCLLSEILQIPDNNVLLGVEVSEERRAGDIGSLGDVFHRRVFESALREKSERGCRQQLADLLLLSLASSWRQVASRPLDAVLGQAHTWKLLHNTRLCIICY